MTRVVAEVAGAALIAALAFAAGRHTSIAGEGAFAPDTPGALAPAARMGHGLPDPPAPFPGASAGRADAVPDDADTSSSADGYYAHAVTVRGFRRLDPAALAQTGLADFDQRRLREIVEDAYGRYADRQARLDALERTSDEDVRATLLAELGERGYDAYLYATWQPNRLRVLEVTAGSAAAASGLAAGDLLYSYDGRRVFGYDDLGASEEALPARRMELRWTRAGAEASGAVPASDLGFTAAAVRVPPS